MRPSFSICTLAMMWSGLSRYSIDPSNLTEGNSSHRRGIPRKERIHEWNTSNPSWSYETRLGRKSHECHRWRRTSRCWTDHQIRGAIQFIFLRWFCLAKERCTIYEQILLAHQVWPEQEDYWRKDLLCTFHSKLRLTSGFLFSCKSDQRQQIDW